MRDLSLERRRAEQEVVLDALLHEQPPAFRRQREPLAHDRKGMLTADLFAAKSDRAGMRRDQSGDGVQRRGLAAAVGAEQRDHAAFGHFERNVGDADQVAVTDFQMFDLEQGTAHVRGPPINSIGVWPAAALAARVPR